MVYLICLILAIVLVAIYGNGPTRGCRWREDRTGDLDGRRKFVCMACGATDYTPDGKPPKICHARRPKDDSP